MTRGKYAARARVHQESLHAAQLREQKEYAQDRVNKLEAQLEEARLRYDALVRETGRTAERIAEERLAVANARIGELSVKISELNDVIKRKQEWNDKTYTRIADFFRETYKLSGTEALELFMAITDPERGVTTVIAQNTPGRPLTEAHRVMEYKRQPRQGLNRTLKELGIPRGGRVTSDEDQAQGVEQAATQRDPQS